MVARDCPPNCTTQEWIVHGTKTDVVTVVVVGILALPFVLGNIILIIYRNWGPIKQKLVWFTVLSSAAGLFWIFSTIVVTNTFERGGEHASFLSYCQLFTFWLQLAFGSCLWVNCINVQLYRYYCFLYSLQQTVGPAEGRGWLSNTVSKTLGTIFRARKGQRHLWIFLCAIEAPILLVSIAASISKPSRWCYCKNDCIFENVGFLVVVWVLLGLYFVVWATLAWQLRDINQELNEYKDAVHAGTMGLVLFVMALIITFTEDYKYSGGRTLITVAVAAEVYYYFWVRCFKEVWGVLFDKDEYLVRWTMRVQAEGLFRKRNRRGHLSAPAADSEDYPDPIVVPSKDAIQVAEDRVAELEEERDHLRAMVGELLEEVKQLGGTAQDSPTEGGFGVHIKTRGRL